MPADVSISSVSTEFIQVPVQVVVNGLPYDPSSDVVQMAFVPLGSSNYPVTWTTGNWTQNPQGVWLAEVLVGSLNGGTALAVGTYTIWCKVIDNPEVPARAVGTVQIT